MSSQNIHLLHLNYYCELKVNSIAKPVYIAITSNWTRVRKERVKKKGQRLEIRALPELIHNVLSIHLLSTPVFVSGRP